MNNNKSTIIGWVLIFAVMVGFFWMNKPSEAQLAEQARLKAVQDSIALVEAQKVLDQAVAEANYNHTLSQDSTSALFLAAKGEEQEFAALGAVFYVVDQMVFYEGPPYRFVSSMIVFRASAKAVWSSRSVRSRMSRSMASIC